MVATVQKRSKLTALPPSSSPRGRPRRLRLEIESDFTRNFRPGSRVVTGYEYVETHLGGAGVWDVLIPAPDVLDEAYFLKVRNLESQLRGIKIDPKHSGEDPATLTKVISLVDILDASKKDATFAAFTKERQVQGMSLAMPAFMGALPREGRARPPLAPDHAPCPRTPASPAEAAAHRRSDPRGPEGLFPAPRGRKSSAGRGSHRFLCPADAT